MVNDYKPKSYLFEDQIDFNLETKRLNYIKSRWFSQKKVLQLKKEYEKENQLKYDYVMVSRIDQAFLSDLIFENYDSNIFWAPNDQKTKEKSLQTKIFLDYFFFSNSSNMDKFSTLYDNLDNIREWKQNNLGKDLNAHEDSFLFSFLIIRSPKYI